MPLWGPRGKPRAVTIDDNIIKAVLESQWNGGRHRLRGIKEVKSQYPELTEGQIQKLANELRSELVANNAKSMIQVEYCEPHLIWSMDIFIKRYQGVKFYVLQVIDLGSRMKLDPAIKTSDFSSEEVAAHINMLMHIHEPPLFLKRDNGGNLNGGEIKEIMRMFAVIPFNSPAHYPQFNGVMERGQGEVKRYLKVVLKGDKKADMFSQSVYWAVDRANLRRRKVLNNRSALECWNESFSHFTRREREAVYNELKVETGRLLEAFSEEKQMRHDAFNSAWRKSVCRYLENKGYIKLYRDGQELRKKMA